MVADISSCGIGEGRRITGISDLLNHRLHRKIGEISGISICKDWFIDGLVSFVIRDPCICYIDRNTLRSHAEPSAGLADADDDIRAELHHLFMDLRNGFVDNGRDLQLRDLCSGDLVFHGFYGFPCRINRLSAEGVEPGDQYVHVNSSLSLQPPLQRGGFSGWKIHTRDINGIFSQETYLTNRVSDVMIDKDIIQENKRIRKHNSCTRTGIF